MIITFSSMKGGVGKTTNAILTATNLAARGYQVLFYDLDPNNSGTMFFTSGIEKIEDIVEKYNVFESLSHNEIDPYVVRTRFENIDIIPSNLNICKLRGIGYSELTKTFRNMKMNYDFVIIDTAPNYDNLVINALQASDLILTPLEFTSFNLTTTKFLEKQLFDDCPNQVEKWFLFYAHWQEKFVPFENSIQMQFVKLFENEFGNILDIHIPDTPAARYYTQTDTPLSVDSPIIGNKRLAKEINKLCNMVTGQEQIVLNF